VAGVSGTYRAPNVTVDTYGRITSISNGSVGITSLSILPGNGIAVTGSPATSSISNITVTNTGVTRLNAGTGIALSGSNGSVTVGLAAAIGSVTLVNISSNTLLVSGSPITSSGTITVDLPSNISISGNITAANVSTSTITATGNIQGGNLRTAGLLSVGGNANVGNIGTAGFITAEGTVRGGALSTGGSLGVTGNANVGNIGATNGVFTNISGNGAALTGLNASNLSSGTVPIGRLGDSGTPSGSTYLRGDNTWATVAGGSSSNSFETIAVAGQSSVVADSATDTLTLAAGTGISITTNAGTDTVTITSTVSAGATAFTGLSDRADLTVDKFYLPAITMLTTTNNGASSYRFDQYGTADNPTLYALNGATIAFNLNVAGHPFLIQTSGGSNYNEGLIHVTTAGVVTTGESAQGQTSGTLYWKIPSSISGNYQYICSIHGAMVGVITIKDFAGI
jgi:plastocyanin